MMANLHISILLCCGLAKVATFEWSLRNAHATYKFNTIHFILFTGGVFYTLFSACCMLLALLLLNVTKFVLFPTWASASLLSPSPNMSAPIPPVPHLLLPPPWPCDFPPGRTLLSASSPSHPAFALSKTHISICPLSLLPLFLVSCFSTRPVERTSSQDGPGRWFTKNNS